MIARAHVTGRRRRRRLLLFRIRYQFFSVSSRLPFVRKFWQMFQRWTESVGLRFRIYAAYVRFTHNLWSRSLGTDKNTYATAAAVVSASTENNNKTLQRDASYFSFDSFHLLLPWGLIVSFFSDLWGKIHHSITHCSPHRVVRAREHQ